MNQSDSRDADYSKLFDSARLRASLTSAGLFITAFELLKLSVVGAPANLLVWLPDQPDQQARYKAETGVPFEERDERGFIPSARWLLQHAAIDEKDLEDILAIRSHRNEIAHELPKILLQAEMNVNVSLLHRARNLIQKVDVWAARSDVLIEMDSMNDVDLSVIPDDQIMSGRIVILDYIITSVTADKT